MRSRFALALALLLVLGSLGQGQLALIAPALPSPTDVLGLIDRLTRKDSETDIDTKADKSVAHGKLLVARTRVQVTLGRSSRNWRGQVHVNLTVPTDVSFTIDLADIKPDHIRSDDKAGKLIVKVPRPRVEDVSPVLTAIKTDNQYKRARFRFLDSDIALELQNAMLLADYLARARTAAEAQVPQVRAEAKVALQALLQRLLRGPFPKVQVEVE